MSQWLQFYFQEANSPNSIDLMWLNDWGLLVSSFVLGFVLYLLFIIATNDSSFLKFSDHQLLETLWTTLPVLLLIALAVPSISILYLHDSAKTWTQIQTPYTMQNNDLFEEEIMSPFWMEETPPNDGLVIKVTGNQWYWTYEYTPWIPLLKNLSFDSYLTQHQDPDTLNVSLSNYRLMNVDNELVLPAWTKLKFIMSSNDVIHAFAVPSLALKADTIPGTSSQFNISMNLTGQFTGFCMELCGTGHANMPVVIHATHPIYFCAWLMKSISL
uniref:cytochrome c oxidase subunit II n=1 Tax=Iheyomytilidicola lauensis TaxID=998671 RepID=UPI001EDE7CDE|nr:cytochrome c oxidase subunit II [Iheyomytilidicola lauensis]UJV31453.1 cytochrome c oxidase subunit 2 [Iheyomytilidicola lauensis]